METQAEIAEEKVVNHHQTRDAFPEQKGEEDNSQASNSTSVAEGNVKYPHGVKLALIIIAIMLATFLVALDETIIATAIPRITKEFQSLDQVGWYGSAYFLTSCSTQLLYGKIYKVFPLKNVYLSAIALFEVGSILAGAAPNSIALIIGRAISGVGCAGIQAGTVTIVAHSVPLAKRAIFYSTTGGVYGVASVLGPVLGGIFTSDLSWRWCFYINIPLGTVTLIVILFFFEAPKEEGRDGNQTFVQQLRSMDLLGSALFIPSVISLLLAIQWGGTAYSWDNARIIALFIIFGVLLALFIGLQVHKKEEATLPPRIMTQRTVAFSALYNLCLGAAASVLEYYLPIYFQGVRGLSALESGVRTLPMILGFVVFGIIAGFGTAWLGYCAPFMIFGSIFMSIGAGLLTTLQVSSPAATYLGYQVLVGAGGGIGVQQAFTALGAVVEDGDVPVASSLVIFSQILGSTLSVTAAQSIFTNRLRSGLETQVTQVNTTSVLVLGASDLRSQLNLEYVDVVIDVYNAAITRAFVLGAALAAMAIIGALGIEWKSVKEKSKPENK